MHTLVVLLVMEILGMESLEDDPAMSPASGEKVERTAFLRQTAREVVMRAWGCVPQSEVDGVPGATPQFPSDYNRKMLKVSYAYCICKSGMILWNREPVLINRHGKVFILLSIKVYLVFFSRVSCTEFMNFNQAMVLFLSYRFRPNNLTCVMLRKCCFRTQLWGRRGDDRV